jgi:G3E family GTPase
MGDTPAKLLFLTGFLGSGKTTLLNRLLKLLEGSRVGIIVNEWGDINIDAGLIENATGDEVIELSGGQIFCSCLSGSFVNAVVKLSSYKLDYILTEASGLAKPSVLMEIVREAEKRSEGSLVYDGMICIIDASRYLILREVVNAVDEQVAYSDRFVLNKSDLASPEDIQAIKELLGELRPGYRVYETVNASVEREIFSGPQEVSNTISYEKADPKYKGWGACGRPTSCTVTPKEAVGRAELRAFLSAAADFSYRIKGYAPLLPDGARYLVDCVGEQIKIAETAASKKEGKLPEASFVVIGKGAMPPSEDIRRAWNKALDGEVEIV